MSPCAWDYPLQPSAVSASLPSVPCQIHTSTSMQMWRMPIGIGDGWYLGEVLMAWCHDGFDQFLGLAHDLYRPDQANISYGQVSGSQSVRTRISTSIELTYIYLLPILYCHPRRITFSSTGALISPESACKTFTCSS